MSGTVGDPAEIVDGVYDFAAQLLALNKEFVHRLLEVSEPGSTTPSRTGAKKTKTAAE
jgi:hypothetical protein